MKVKKLRLCLLLALILLIGGCATTPPPPFYPSTPPEGQALIYFYWPAIFLGSHYGPKVLDNNLCVFNLGNGKYIQYFLNPGRHEFRTDTIAIDEPLTFEIKQGEVYFLRCEFKRGAFIGTWLITRKYPEQALEEIKFCDEQIRRHTYPLYE